MMCYVKIYYKDLPATIYCMIPNVIKYGQYGDDIIVTCRNGDKHYISMKYTATIEMMIKEDNKHE